MLRSFLTALALAAALSFAVNAQSQSGNQPPSTKPPQTTPPQAAKQQTVMVTGCVQRGAQSGTYIMAAQQTPLSSQMSQRLSGNVPTPIYLLVGHAREMEAMLGHRVEVKGVTQAHPEATVQQGQGTTTTEPKAQGTSGKKPRVTTDTKEKVELRRLDVETVTSVQGACQ